MPAPIVASLAARLGPMLANMAATGAQNGVNATSFQKIAGHFGANISAQQSAQLGHAVDVMGSMREMKDAIGESTSRAGTAAGEFFTSRQKPLTQVGGVLSSVGDKMGEFAPTMLMGGAVKVVGELAQSVEKLQAWNHSLNQYDMQFSRASAGMAGVASAQEYMAERSLEERGDRRAQGAAEFSAKSARLDRQLGQVEDSFIAIKEKVAGAASDVFSGALEMIGADGKIENETDVSTERWMHGWMGAGTDLSQVDREIQARRPKNMGGNQ